MITLHTHTQKKKNKFLENLSIQKKIYRKKWKKWGNCKCMKK